MDAPQVQNIIPISYTGYIQKERLEELLVTLFHRALPVRFVGGRFQFTAPRLVTIDELMSVWNVPLVEGYRTNA
ncbi:hypothetical protein BJX61DRAFT_544666 [Aspergillus egyptiacus]|nr:hypothetical protein BJX61DRAFT_544666 [Aspergillus egyptiacus]